VELNGWGARGVINSSEGNSTSIWGGGRLDGYGASKTSAVGGSNTLAKLASGEGGDGEGTIGR